MEGGRSGLDVIMVCCIVFEIEMEGFTFSNGRIP